MTHARRLVFVPVIAAACLAYACKSADANTLKLGDSGWIVDAPDGWKVETHNDHWFTVRKLTHGFDVRLDKALDGAAPADDVRFKDLIHAMSCDEPAKAETGRTPAGGYYAQCTSTHTLTGKTIPATVVLLVGITTDKIRTGCSVKASPKLDADDAAACKSLRNTTAPK